MQNRTTLALSLLVVAWLGTTHPAGAGSAVEGLDIAGSTSTIPGFLDAKLVPARWDARCIPVQLSFNTAVLPNPEGPGFISREDTRAVIESAMDTWNSIPTSFIELRLVDELDRTGDVTRFDFINEVNFLGGPASPFVSRAFLTTLVADTTLLAGDDIDQDGDSDVFSPDSGDGTCDDVDGDGDIEFPAGFYLAGTILESDVSVNSFFNWTIDEADADANVFGVDLPAIITEAFGQAHGLGPSTINQISSAEGTGATMFPLIDSTDPADELSKRSLSTDDIAWSSFLYPEGSATGGAAALAEGDVAFDDVFGVITGEVIQGDQGLPLAGGSLFAVDRETGEVAAAAITGSGRVGVAAPGTFPVDTGLERSFDGSQSFHITDGRYSIPVPAGEYHLVIEPIDGFPLRPANANGIAVLGSQFGQTGFNEEFVLEDDDEFEPVEVEVEAGEVVNVDHTTSVDTNIDNFDTIGFRATADFDGLGFSNPPPSRLYALQIPASQMSALAAGEDLLIKGAAFRIFTFDSSVPPVFQQASFTTGSVEGTSATIDLEQPLARIEDFLGQDNDFAPAFFPEPEDLGETVLELIEEDGVTDFFIVLQLPATSTPGINGDPLRIGLDSAGAQEPGFGRSFISDDGGATFTQFESANFMFRLITSTEDD